MAELANPTRRLAPFPVCLSGGRTGAVKLALISRIPRAAPKRIPICSPKGRTRRWRSAAHAKIISAPLRAAAAARAWWWRCRAWSPRSMREPGWDDTVVRLPPAAAQRWRNVLTGAVVDAADQDGVGCARRRSRVCAVSLRAPGSHRSGMMGGWRRNRQAGLTGPAGERSRPRSSACSIETLRRP